MSMICGDSVCLSQHDDGDVVWWQVLGIVAGVLMQDHEVHFTDFHQLPYHRIFIMLFIELNAPEPVLENINFQVLSAFWSVLCCQSSGVSLLLSVLCCQSSAVSPLLSVLWCQSSAVSPLLSVFCCQSSGVSLLLSVFWCQSSAVSLLLSVLWCQSPAVSQCHVCLPVQTDYIAELLCWCCVCMC